MMLATNKKISFKEECFHPAESAFNKGESAFLLLPSGKKHPGHTRLCERGHPVWDPD